ncbi:MAG: hypothetical protein ACYDHV_00615 [Desulfurivibrionaceae bacterium]|jgi:NADH dehydrogenase FAD-containing subunit|nr:hypothetical protein [Desulfurivibrionaceae bacterium]MDP2757730.1 hypothetical protein [Desulfurivibrionaceae bacterium]
MGKHLVFIGGGHAHMMTLASLSRFTAKGHEVTVIGPSPYHYYSGMGPGMLAGMYRPEEIRFATRRVVERQGAAFVLGKAARIDPLTKTVHLENGGTIPYDVLSCNAGSFVPHSILGHPALPALHRFRTTGRAGRRAVGQRVFALPNVP